MSNVKMNQKAFKKPNTFFNPRISKIQAKLNKYNYKPKKKKNIHSKKIHKETISIRNPSCNNFSNTFSNLSDKLGNESFINLKESFFGEKCYPLDSFFSKEIQDKMNITSSGSQVIKNKFYPKFTSTPFNMEKQDSEKVLIVEAAPKDDTLQISFGNAWINNSFKENSKTDRPFKDFQNIYSDFLPTYNEHKSGLHNFYGKSFNMKSFLKENISDLNFSYNAECRSISNEDEIFSYGDFKDPCFRNDNESVENLNSGSIIESSSLKYFGEESIQLPGIKDFANIFKNSTKKLKKETKNKYLLPQTTYNIQTGFENQNLYRKRIKSNINFKNKSVGNCVPENKNCYSNSIQNDEAIKSYNVVENNSLFITNFSSKDFVANETESNNLDNLNKIHFPEHIYKTINGKAFKNNGEEKFQSRSFVQVSSRNFCCKTCNEIRENKKKVFNWLDCNNMSQCNKSIELLSTNNKRMNNSENFPIPAMNKCILPYAENENKNILKSLMNSNSSKQYFIFYN